VKIRGFRVEPGEIHTAIAVRPEVGRVAVIVREDQPGRRRLVAYVVAAEGAEVDVPALRAHVAERLPDYMVPAAFVVLRSLPVTANGKLDRKALPAPEPETTEARGPRNPREEMLCKLFAEVLGRPTVGIDGNFFELGGDSIISIQLMSRIRSIFGVQLGNRAIFQASTVAAMAELVGGGTGQQDGLAVMLPLRTGGERPPLFFFHPLSGVSWMYAGLMPHIPGEYPVYGVQAPNLGSDRPDPRSLEELAGEYLERIREIQPSGPYHLLGWSMGALLAHEIAVRLRRQGERIGLLANLDQPPISRDMIDDEGPAPSDEQNVLGGLLDFVGLDPGVFGGEPLERDKVMALLRAEGSALASFDEEHILRIGQVSQHNLALCFDHTPQVFDGDLLLFAATPDPETEVADIRDRVDRMRPYVTGEIRVEAVRTEHRRLLNAGPAAEVGRAVRQWLDQRRDTP
jgi:thioesterase domain-containing protein/acyl carrier protein